MTSEETKTPATPATPAPPAKPAAADAPPPLLKMSSMTVDVDKEDGGDWIDIPTMAPAQLRVRSLEYRPYKVALARHARAHMKKHKGNDTEESEREDFEARGALLAKHILLGWRGFEQEYSADLAATWLPSRNWRPLREWTLYCAQQVGVAEVEFVEAAAKNSGKSSATA